MNEGTRFPIGSRIYKHGRLLGEIMSYGSDADETYLVDCEGMMSITNRSRIEFGHAVVAPPASDSWWARKDT